MTGSPPLWSRDQVSPTLAYTAAALVGLLGVAALFPMPVLLGTASFWDNPSGTVRYSFGDMKAALSGYQLFVRQPWHWPLITQGLGVGGTSIAYTDSVPLVAVLGRIAFALTGRMILPYGVWAGGCFLANALAITALVRALGARGLATAVAAATFAVSMPALIGRWGHLSLLAQALIPFALLIYLQLVRAPVPPRPMKLLLGCMGLAALSLSIHPYLMAMVAGVLAAGLCQAAANRRLPWSRAVLGLSGFAASLVVTAAALGYGTNGAPATAIGFGLFSTNPLSLFVPPGTLIPGTTRLLADATGYQYEGAIYFGPGLIGVLVLTLGGARWRPLRAAYNRHGCLALVVLAFSALALSLTPTLGPYVLGHIEPPFFLQVLFGVFRASGRFAWLGLYLASALAIAALGRRRWGGPALLMLAALQWWGVEPLRHALRASLHPPPPVLDRAAWQHLLDGADQLIVTPAFACLARIPDDTLLRAQVAIDLQFFASRTGVPTNTVYAARMNKACVPPHPTRRSVLVDFNPVSAAPADFDCATGLLIRVCVPADQNIRKQDIASATAIRS